MCCIGDRGRRITVAAIKALTLLTPTTCRKQHMAMPPPCPLCSPAPGLPRDFGGNGLGRPTSIPLNQRTSHRSLPHPGHSKVPRAVARPHASVPAQGWGHANGSGDAAAPNRKTPAAFATGVPSTFSPSLPAQARLGGQRGRARLVPALQVVQKLAAQRHQLHQTPAGMVVCLVGLEMFGQRRDARRQDRHLRCALSASA